MVPANIVIAHLGRNLEVCLVRVRVRVSVPYVSKEVIFRGKVNRREVRVLSGGIESFGNAVVK